MKVGLTIQTKPYVKPTSLGMPLSCESAHPHHVHQSWPRAVISRLSTYASTQGAAEAAKQLIVTRFHRHFTTHGLLRLLLDTPVGGNRRCPLQAVESSNRLLLAAESSERLNRVWCTIPYHPVWANMIATSIHKLRRCDNSSRLLCMAFESKAPNISISWKGY